MRALALLLLSSVALAQHQHAPVDRARPPAVDRTTSVKDDSGRAAKAAVLPQESVDHAAAHAIPLGKGMAPDGTAWLRIDVSGCYVVHNAEVTGWIAGRACTQAGTIWFVRSRGTVLVWTRPDGIRERVPDANLIADTKLVGSGK